VKNGILPTNTQNHVVYKEAVKSCENVVLIIYNVKKQNYCGLARLVEAIGIEDVDGKSMKNFQQIIEEYTYKEYFRVEWLWSTRLYLNKVDSLINPLNNNNYFVDSKDGQEVSIDLGIYITKMMMNRLTEKEIDKFEYKNSRLLEKSKNLLQKGIKGHYIQR